MPDLEVTKTWIAKNLKHERQVTRCRFSPCGKYVFTGGLEEQLLRWDLATEQKIPLVGHRSWLGALAFHPDGRRLFTGDYHGVVHCWSYADAAPKPLWSIPNACSGWVRALTVSPDGRYVATGGCRGEVRLWSAQDGKPVRPLEEHQAHVFSLAWHPNDGTLVTGDLMGRVRQWEVNTGRSVRELNASVLHTRKEDFLADVGGVRAMAFDARGTKLACGGLRDAESNTFCPGTPSVPVFDWETGKLERELKVTGKVDGYVNAVRYLPDGTLAGCGEGTSGAGLWFWKPDAEDPFHTFASPSGYDLDLHPDGVTLAAALYENRGHAGNGRRAKSPGEYVTNMGLLRLYALYAKPS